MRCLDILHQRIAVLWRARKALEDSQSRLREASKCAQIVWFWSASSGSLYYVGRTTHNAIVDVRNGPVKPIPA